MPRDNMTIRPYGHGGVLIQLPGGHTLHVCVDQLDQNGIQLALYDHFHLSIHGPHKGPWGA